MTTNLLSQSFDTLCRLGRHPVVLGVQAMTLLCGALLGSLELAGVHTGPPTREMLAARRVAAQHAQAVADSCYIRIEQGDAADALPICREAVCLAPSDGWARKNLALALLRTKKPTEATAALEIAVDLAPDLDEAHFLLGNAYERRGYLDLAQCQYRLAIRVNPSHFGANWRRAQIFEKLGWDTEAIREYQTAVRLRPDHRGASGSLIALLRRYGRLNEVRELQKQQQPNQF